MGMEYDEPMEDGPAVATQRRRRRVKRCPFCAETIMYEAVKCRYCGEFLYGDRQHSCAQPDVTYDDEQTEADDEAWEDAFDEDDEQDDGVLYAGRPSVFALTSTLVGTLLVVVWCGAMWSTPLEEMVSELFHVNMTGQRAQTALFYTRRVALLIGGYALAVCLCKVAALKSVYYVVTADRVEWSRGIFSREVDNLDMYRIVDLNLRRSIWDCVVGIGTVTLVTKDKSTPEFVFHKVPDCRYLYDEVKRASLDADKEHGVIHTDS